jgi:hypothetical protein
MNSVDDPVMSGRLRVMQIIAAALLIGVTTFLVIVLYLVHVQNQGHGNAPPGNLPIISLMGAGFLVVLAVLSFVIPAMIVRSNLAAIAAGTWKPPQRRSPAFIPVEAPATDAGKLFLLYQSTMIVGLAPLEGACFFNCIAYLVEAQPYTLGVLGIGILLMLARFPTEGRVRHWLEDRQERLAQVRREVGSGSPPR